MRGSLNKVLSQVDLTTSITNLSILSGFYSVKFKGNLLSQLWGMLISDNVLLVSDRLTLITRYTISTFSMKCLAGLGITRYVNISIDRTHKFDPRCTIVTYLNGSHLNMSANSKQIIYFVSVKICGSGKKLGGIQNFFAKTIIGGKCFFNYITTTYHNYLIYITLS